MVLALCSNGKQPARYRLLMPGESQCAKGSDAALRDGLFHLLKTRVVESLGVFPHFCDTRESPRLYGGLVFGKPFLLHHSGHFPQPCSRHFLIFRWFLRESITGIYCFVFCQGAQETEVVSLDFQLSTGGGEKTGLAPGASLAAPFSSYCVQASLVSEGS